MLRSKAKDRPCRYVGITWAVLIAMNVMFFREFAGQLEGYVFPVLRDTKLTDIEPVGETRARFRGHFVKIRDCSFVDIEFRFGHPGHYTVAAVIFEEPTRLRAPGFHEIGPWVVELSPAQLADSYAVVFHRCPGRPWLTETRFYP